MPLNSPDYHLLFVSDLHLSEGRDEQTKRLSRNEDFLFDEEFGRFLDYHTQHYSQRKWHLIINGDFCDFLQVLSTTFDGEFLAYLGVGSEKEGRQKLEIAEQNTKYGFDAGPGETVFKLWKILNGHWMFTCALIRFVEAGNILSINWGNHDPEWAYDTVRDHFRQMLRWFYLQKKCGAADPAAFHQVCCERVQFLDWFYYEPGLIWAEHGGQYEAVNCFPHGLAPFLPNDDHIEMPWGSFFVRYFFNSVEQQEPFADNIKPQSSFISWMVTRHPLLSLQFLYGNGRHMLNKMRRAWLVKETSNARVKVHREKLDRLEKEWSVPAGVLKRFDDNQAESVFRNPKGSWKLWRMLTLVWPATLTLVTILVVAAVLGGLSILGHIFSPIAPPAVTAWRVALVSRFAGGATHDVYSFFHWLAFIYLVVGVVEALTVIVVWIYRLNKPVSSEQCYLVDEAEYVQSQLHVQYVTMGHTHDTDLAALSSGAEYFNTGTWTKVFSPDEKLTREESELVFLQGLREDGGLTCRLMKWEDGVGEPRLVKLFSDVTAPCRLRPTEKATTSRMQGQARAASQN